MANGVKTFRKLQLARNADSDSDDVIAATTILRANGLIEDTRNLYFVDEDTGLATGSDRTNTSLLGGKIAIDPIEATFEQFPYFIEMSIQSLTGVTDSGDAYVYTCPIPTTSFNALRPYTVEGGDNNQAEVLNFVHCSDWTLSGSGGKAWMMSGNLFGKQVQDQAFTGGVTIPAVNTMNFGKTKLYIDNDSDTWGTSQIANTLLAATIKYKANLVAKETAEGALTFSFVQQVRPEITVDLLFEYNTGAHTQKNVWRTETPKLVRLLNQGTAFTSPGNTYAYRTFIADLAGKYNDFEKIGEQNGNDVIQAHFTARYNDAQASAGQFVIVNAKASLP